MFSRPTTDQILQGIAAQLRETVLPTVTSEPARVLLGQIDQLLHQCAVRAAHEVAWIHDEVGAIEAELGVDLGPPASLHLDDVVAWYGAAGRTLERAIDEAFAVSDADRQARLAALLEARSANEMRIVGVLDLVGRG